MHTQHAAGLQQLRTQGPGFATRLWSQTLRQRCLGVSSQVIEGEPFSSTSCATGSQNTGAGAPLFRRPTGTLPLSLLACAMCKGHRADGCEGSSSHGVTQGRTSATQGVIDAPQ